MTTRARVLVAVASVALVACAANEPRTDANGTGGRAMGGTGGLFNTGGSGGLFNAGGTGGGTGGNQGSGGHQGHDGRPADPDPPDAAVDHPAVPPEVLAIAGGLQGAFLQLDCRGPEIELQFCLPELMGKKSVTVKLGGTPGKKYAVALGVWGVMETVTYRNGKPAGGSLYVGGESGTPMTAEWGLSDDTTTYFLNYFPTCAGEHYTYGIHYESQLLTLTGGSTLTLFVRDPDDFINTNHMDSQAPDPPPGLIPMLTKIRAMPLMGQFVYVEVVSAQELP